MIVGSSNFTKEAFNKNTEANTLITNKDINSESILATAFKLINESWKKSKYFDDKELIRYRTIWKNHRPKIKSLSGFYGSDNGDSKPIHEVAVTTMTWDEFVKKVRNDRTHGLKKRLRVISIAQDLFSSKEHFNELEDEERKFIAGIPNKCKIRGAEEWGFFGSMKGSGVFKNKIIFNDSNISNALDKIPLKGQITKTHYDNFINTFKKAFIGTSLENTKCIAIASRLLAMKRPDIFVCLASKNKSKLCKDFGIPQSNMSFERYWEDIILRIFDSDWWRNPETKDEQEVEISKSRVAFLDALYYVPSIN